MIHIDSTGQLVYPCRVDGWVYVIYGIDTEFFTKELEFTYDYRYDYREF